MKLENQPLNDSTSAVPPGIVFDSPTKTWPLDKRAAILDVLLLLTAILLIFTPDKIFFFHIMFVLLTYGAFYWRFRAFSLRAVIWVTLTTVVLLVSIIGGQVPSAEMVEIPLMTVILVLVFFIARQRSLVRDALHRSEERYHTLFDNLFKASRDAIFTTNRDGTVTSVNQSLQDLFGYSELEIVGRDFEQLAADSPENGAAILSEITKKGSIQDYELELTKNDGTKMTCLLTSSLWRANDGRVLGYQGIIRDITHRKLSDQALRESEERYRRLVELSFEAVAVYNLEGIVVYINSAGARLLGATEPDKIIGRPVLDFVHPDYLEIVRQRVAQVQNGGRGAPLVEEQLIRLDGTTVAVEVAAVPITFRFQPAVEIVIRDISTRKRAAAEREVLLQTEQEQRLLAETLGSVFLALTAQTSRETVLDEILRQVQRVVPYSAANIALIKDGLLQTTRHQGYRAFGGEPQFVSISQPLKNFPLDTSVVSSKQPLFIMDVMQEPLWVTIPGTEWIRSSIIVPICLRDSVIGLLRLDGATPGQFSAKDINFLEPLSTAAAIALENAQLYDQARQELAERRLVEKDLRELSAKNQAILDILPDSLFHVRGDGTLLDFKIVEGSILQELMSGLQNNKNLRDMLLPDLVDRLQVSIDSTLATRTTQIFEYQLPLPRDTRDFEVWLVASGPDEVFAIVRDVTERKMHAAALEKERARIARDLHDSLGQSLGYLRLKLDGFTSPAGRPVPEYMRKDLIQMRDATNEAYELVRSMIATALPANSTNLATVLLAQARTVGNRSRFKVALASYGQPQPLTPVVQQQFLYVFTEALNNVAQHAGAQNVSIQLNWEPNRLTMTLTDDGCGFDPYSPPQHGHFGLTIMYERTADIGGNLSIKSERNQGTELTLRLPLLPAI